MNASKATQDQSIAEGRLKPQGQTRLRSHEKQLSLGVESPGVESPNITTQPCTVTGPRVISRDEMNLAEFPLAVLSTRSNPNIKTLEFSDSIRGKRGELINRKWIITGADKFGLPTSSDDEVLLGLMKLTVDKGFESRKIHFTRYELLKALQWSTEGRSYTRLQRALDRLSGVRIKASNAFFDNSAKKHSTRNFGIIDAYELNDGKGTKKPSFFQWSEVLFDSFQAGFIKKLDLDFYLSLRSAVSKRLYRYLDKHFWYNARVRCNVFILAHEKLGVSRGYRYVSSIRQQLDPAIEELAQRGYLSHAEYTGRGKGAEIVLYAAAGSARSKRSVSAKRTESARAESAKSGRSASESSEQASDALGTDMVRNGCDSAHDSSNVYYQKVRALLVQRGLRPSQVFKLLGRAEQHILERVERIVLYFDQLVSSNSHLVSRSPVGFLYRAVENPTTFSLPDDEKTAKGKGSYGKVTSKEAQRHLRLVQNSGKPNSGGGNVVGIGEGSEEALQTRYLRARRKAVQGYRSDVEPKLLKRMTAEVEASLTKLRGVIAEERFQEAVELGLEDKLASMFVFPSFEEWAAEQAKL